VFTPYLSVIPGRRRETILITHFLQGILALKVVDELTMWFFTIGKHPLHHIFITFYKHKKNTIRVSGSPLLQVLHSNNQASAVGPIATEIRISCDPKLSSRIALNVKNKKSRKQFYFLKRWLILFPSMVY